MELLSADGIVRRRLETYYCDVLSREAVVPTLVKSPLLRFADRVLEVEVTDTTVVDLPTQQWVRFKSTSVLVVLVQSAEVEFADARPVGYDAVSIMFSSGSFKMPFRLGGCGSVRVAVCDMGVDFVAQAGDKGSFANVVFRHFDGVPKSSFVAPADIAGIVKAPTISGVDRSVVSADMSLGLASYAGVVLVRNGSDRDVAEKLFRKATVYSVSEVEGKRFKRVLLCVRPVSDSRRVVPPWTEAQVRVALTRHLNAMVVVGVDKDANVRVALEELGELKRLEVAELQQVGFKFD